MTSRKASPASCASVYDRSRDRARASIEQTEALLRAYNREWARGRLLLRGVAPEVANPLDVEAHDLATPQSTGSLVLFLVAFYGLFAALMGGLGAALDATAGERERQSLEPLLATPVRPLELAIGKWIAVVALDGTVVLLTLAGFYLTLRFAPLPAVGIPFLFGAREFARFVVVLLPLVLLMPAVMLFVGARGPHVQGSAGQRIASADARRADPVRAHVPAAEGSALARVDSGFGPILALDARAAGEALTWAGLAQSYVVPLALAALALALVGRLLARESTLAGT